MFFQILIFIGFYTVLTITMSIVMVNLLQHVTNKLPFNADDYKLLTLASVFWPITTFAILIAILVSFPPIPSVLVWIGKKIELLVLTVQAKQPNEPNT